MLFQFKTVEDLAQWVPFADAELGGQSTSVLQPAEEPQVCAAMGQGAAVTGPALCLSNHLFACQDH